MILDNNKAGEPARKRKDARPYWEKLKDPRWQKMRLEIMDRDGFKCTQCDDAKSTLNVHHAYYIKGRYPWEYPEWSLRTLCEECHSIKHSESAEDEDPIEEWEKMVGFVFGGSLLYQCGRKWDMAVNCGMLASKIGQYEFESWLFHAAGDERTARNEESEESK